MPSGTTVPGGLKGTGGPTISQDETWPFEKIPLVYYGLTLFCRFAPVERLFSLQELPQDLKTLTDAGFYLHPIWSVHPLTY